MIKQVTSLLQVLRSIMDFLAAFAQLANGGAHRHLRGSGRIAGDQRPPLAVQPFVHHVGEFGTKSLADDGASVVRALGDPYGEDGWLVLSGGQGPFAEVGRDDQGQVHFTPPQCLVRHLT